MKGIFEYWQWVLSFYFFILALHIISKDESICCLLFFFLAVLFVIFLWPIPCDAPRTSLCLLCVEERSRQVLFLPLFRRRLMAGASPAVTWNRHDRCVGILGWWPTFCLSSFGLLKTAASGTCRRCILQRYRFWWQVGRVTSLYLRRMYGWCGAALNDACVTSQHKGTWGSH